MKAFVTVGVEDAMAALPLSPDDHPAAVADRIWASLRHWPCGAFVLPPQTLSRCCRISMDRSWRPSRRVSRTPVLRRSRSVHARDDWGPRLAITECLTHVVRAGSLAEAAAHATNSHTSCGRSPITRVRCG
jgi:hypothetical protein